MDKFSLIGKEVTAIGDCGMDKNQTVKGILKYDTTVREWYVKKDKFRISLINENTIKPAFALEYHREPTKGEIKFGHGATHYKDFEPAQYLKTNGEVKQWLICPIDNLRYYRN